MSDHGDSGAERNDREELEARNAEIRTLRAKQGDAAQPRFAMATMPAERSADFTGAMRRLWSALEPERPLMVTVVLLALGSNALIVQGPRLLGEATDLIFRGAYDGSGVDFSALGSKLLFVLAIYAAANGSQFGQGWFMTRVVQRTVHRLRTDAESKIHALPLSYVDQQQRGDLLSRVTNDLDNFANSLQQTMGQFLNSIFNILGILAVMAWISPLLTLVGCVTIPLSIVAVQRIAVAARPRFLDQWKQTGLVNGHAEEVFTGHEIVAAFGRRDEVRDLFDADNDKLYDAALRASFLTSLIQPINVFLGNVQYVIIAVAAGFRVSSGAISIGEMQAFIQYSRQVQHPITQMSAMANVFQSGIASLERVLELLDAPEQTPDPDVDVDDATIAGRVEFHDVAFAYTSETDLISDLSLLAEPGQTIAIVGPTGAGKTTLVNLIMRFYELDGGAITLDGVDLATRPRRHIRSRVGMVLQDTWLFGGTIRDNIGYGRPTATDEEILAAAQATYVDRFVHSLPDGYDTVIGEEGDTLSAGERQLITIARAFLADPAILILDEATSSVDTRTEMLVQDAMNRLRADRTSFVIAHRLSTIRGADLIVVMTDGRIVEQGSHHDLVQRGGAYAELHEAQFAGAVVDLDEPTG